MGRIKKRIALVLAAMAVALSLSACGGGGELLLGYYLYQQLLNNGSSSQKMIWSGVVTDGTNKPLKGYTVEILANRPDPASDERKSAVTNDTGQYSVAIMWYQVAAYEISVYYQNTTVYHDNIGPVFYQNQTRDIQVPTVSTVAVSGTVVDGAGAASSQAFVCVARPQSLGDTPDTLVKNAEGKTAYMLTNNTGVYLIENVFGSPLLVAGFSPSLGFGYYYIDAPSSVNAGGTVTLPGKTPIPVRVRVLNTASEPLANTILPVDFRFKIKLTPTYNLSTQVATAVRDASLFSGITSEEIIAMHPVAGEANVASTSADGIADITLNLVPGAYKLELASSPGGVFPGVLVGSFQRLLKDAAGEIIEVRIPLA